MSRLFYLLGFLSIVIDVFVIININKFHIIIFKLDILS
jgi:hypothetical protein